MVESSRLRTRIWPIDPAFAHASINDSAGDGRFQTAVEIACGLKAMHAAAGKSIGFDAPVIEFMWHAGMQVASSFETLAWQAPQGEGKCLASEPSC